MGLSLAGCWGPASAPVMFIMAQFDASSGDEMLCCENSESKWLINLLCTFSMLFYLFLLGKIL